MADVGSLVLKLTVQAGQGIAALKTATGALGNLGSAAALLPGALGQFAAVGQVWEQLQGLAKAGMAAAKEQMGLARAFGVSNTAAAGFQAAAAVAGVELSAARVGLGFMQRNLFQAAQGSAAAAIGFRMLGLDAQKLQAMGFDAALTQVARRLNEVDAATRAVATREIFGRSGEDAAKLLRKLEEGRQIARDFATSLSTADAAKIKEAEDAVKSAAAASAAFMQGLWQDVTAALAPAIKAIADLIKSWWKALMPVRKVLGFVLDIAGKVVQVISFGLKVIGDVISGIGRALGIGQSAAAAAREETARRAEEAARARSENEARITADLVQQSQQMADELRRAFANVGSPLTGEMLRTEAQIVRLRARIAEVNAQQFAAGEAFAAAAAGGANQQFLQQNLNAQAQLAQQVGPLQEQLAQLQQLQAQAIEQQGQQALQSLEDRREALVGVTRQELEIARLRRLGVNEAQIARVEAMQEQVALLERQQAAGQQLARLTDQFRTPLEAFNAELERLVEISEDLIPGMEAAFDAMGARSLLQQLERAEQTLGGGREASMPAALMRGGRDTLAAVQRMQRQPEQRLSIEERMLRVQEQQRALQEQQADDLRSMERLISSGRLARVVNLGP